METCAERRKRKLIALAAEKGGLRTIAADCGLSHAALDQVVKGVLLPEREDGVRREKSLGEDAARAIEKRYKLERGWFDSDEVHSEPLALSAALDALAASLQTADASARIAVASLLSAMATDPEGAKNKSELILKLLVTPRDNVLPQDQDALRRSHIFVRGERLDLGDANGRRDKSAATGGEKK